MTPEQITVELQDLSNRLDRLEQTNDEIHASLTLLIDTTVPAVIKDFRHTLGGTDILVANLAGTVEALAITLGTVSDRLTLLERNWE